MSDDKIILHASRKIGRALNEASQGNYSIVSLQGGSRSGKTYTTILWLVTEALQRDSITISIVRATLPALRGSAIVDFKEIMHKVGLWDDERYNKTEHTYTFTNGSLIEFFSCDNEQKLRGRKRDILFCNEANELDFLTWQQLKMRTAYYSIIDYNPSFTPEHWINQVNAEPTTLHIVTTYKDNIKHLPAEIVREIESLQTKNANLWQIYGLGEMATIEGVVFPDFEQVEAIPQEIDRRYIGVDFGYTNDFTAIIEVAIEGENLYVNEIAYKTHLLSSDIIRILRDFPRHNVISESADPRLVAEIQYSGVRITPVKKYPGSIQAGLVKMQGMKIHVTKSSLNVIKELRNYCYQKNQGGQFTNVPIDTFNHAIDAIRYVVLTTNQQRPRHGGPIAILV